MHYIKLLETFQELMVWNCVNGFNLGGVNLTSVFWSVRVHLNIQCTFPKAGSKTGLKIQGIHSPVPYAPKLYIE